MCGMATVDLSFGFMLGLLLAQCTHRTQSKTATGTAQVPDAGVIPALEADVLRTHELDALDANGQHPELNGVCTKKKVGVVPYNETTIKELRQRDAE